MEGERGMGRESLMNVAEELKVWQTIAEIGKLCIEICFERFDLEV